MEQLIIGQSPVLCRDPDLESRCIQAFRETGQVHRAADKLKLPWYQVQGVLVRCGQDLTERKPEPALKPEESYFAALVPEATHRTTKENGGNTNFRVGNLNVQVVRATKSGDGWTVYVGHQERKPDLVVGVLFDRNRLNVERIAVIPIDGKQKPNMSVRPTGINWRLTIAETELRDALHHLQK